MATNRIETLDPALIRPGRIDRKIEFPLPDEKTKRRIFTIHTSRMTLSDDVDLEDYIMAKDDLSGADIKVGALNLKQHVSTLCIRGRGGWANFTSCTKNIAIALSQWYCSFRAMNFNNIKH